MTRKILMIDDDKDILASYQVNLRKDFIVRIASNANQAMEILKEEADIGVIVTDYKMPDVNGINLLKMIRQIYPDPIRIMITGFADMQIAVNAVNEGSIFRFLTKPMPTPELKQIIQDALVQYNLKKNEKELLNNTLKGTLKLLIDLISLSIPQSLNIGSQARLVARKIGVKTGEIELWELEVASLLSNIGLLMLPNEIIQKKADGKELTSNEVAVYSNLPELGAKLLANIPRFEKISDAILHMNDNFGSKIDRNVANESIPLYSRILKVSNDYIQLIQSNKTPLEAYEKMLELYYQYDPKLLELLLTEVVGSDNKRKIKQIQLMELKGGMVAAKDIVDDRDTVLFKKDKEITEPIIIRLQQISNVRNIVEPLLVYEQ
ncbi:MAG: response regulator [Candidatus Kapabacteria bacterium]|nr:response regulator [Candidatus Kapabacteria bacterium]